MRIRSKDTRHMPRKRKKCNACQKKYYFAHAKVCLGKSVRQMSQSAGESSKEDVAGRVITVDRIPIKEEAKNKVEMTSNDVPIELVVDSGCKKVLLPEDIFKGIKHTTRLIQTRVKLRPYGVKSYLEVKGRAKITIKAKLGKTYETYAYVVKGHQTEPLLGEEASKALGILKINPEGELVRHVQEDKQDKREIDNGIPVSTR